MNPFCLISARDKPLCQVGEDGVLAQLRKWWKDVAPPCPQGPGDDCAVLPPSPRKQGAAPCLLATVDSVVYGRHFDGKISPENAGRKLVCRNLSDIAACAGAPAGALVAVVAGGDLSFEWLKRFVKGMARAMRPLGVQIWGGDLSGGPKGTFSASLTLLGHSARPLLRQGAKAGDSLWITGTLGGSIARKHYAFTPRLKEALWLGKQAQVRALMDVTDGLAKDMPALLPPFCDALLDPAKIPLSAALPRHLSRAQKIARALCDGEDYELLFALAKGANEAAFARRFKAAFPKLKLSRLGKIAPAIRKKTPHLLRRSTPPFAALTTARGFEHFLFGN